MSEKIKITVVIENEKLNNTVDDSKTESVIVTHDSSVTIMSTLLQNNLISGSFCGGRGDCGRCRIQFIQGETFPTALERSVMDPEELRLGYRLACLARPKTDCTIKLALLDAPKIAVVADMIDVTENIDYVSQKLKQSKKHTSDVMEAFSGIEAFVSESEQTGNKETSVMIAVDLGTTTIAMQLMEMDSGRIIDTYCEMNPQRRYGADVLSRIRASCEGNREILQRLAVGVLERGVERFMGLNADIKCMCIAGNTTMEHLLMGYDVSSLGRSPFAPVEIGLQEYKHSDWDFTVWLTPGISTFVGGDIVAGLYACGMLNERLQRRPEEEEQQRSVGQKERSFLVDLGTNGEMAICDGTRMIVTATAAGPAFEGGAGAGIVGSDMVACIAALLEQGILDKTGLLTEPYFTEGVSIQAVDERHYQFASGRSGDSLYLTQQDIRNLQMAKAAVRAGIEVLFEKLNEQRQDKSQPDKSQTGGRQVEQVYLAGGFGYYLDVEAAFRIGLLPEHMRGSVRAVGNTSLMGAYRIGRDLWQHRTDKRALERSIASAESINLAVQEDFERRYIQYMSFPVY